MPTKRSSIEIVVVGLEELRSANTALLTHDKRVQALTGTYQAFNAAVGNMRGGVQQTTNIFNTFNSTVNNTSNVMNAAGRSSQSTLTTLLAYKAVGVVFGQVKRGVDELIKSYAEMERQSARISRVAQPGQMPVLRAGIAEEAARTGASIKDISEGYYQLGTRIKDTTALLEANKVAMNLVVGTEADARETTRLMIQIHEQFGAQLGKNISEGEQYRRVGELIAVSWKGASAETSEMANALKYLGPIAEAAKVPLQQVTGILTALTAEGVRGRMAGTEAGAFLTSIIKGYDSKLGGVARGGKVFKFDLAKTAEGGIDLYKTLENIVKVANQLPTDKAREFLLGISGSQQSFRFLGAQGVSSMREIRDAIDQASKALSGQTHEADKLKDQMMTTAQEFQRAWGGALAAIDNMLQVSGLKSFVHDLANGVEDFNRAMGGAAKADALNSANIYGHNGANAQLMEQRDTLKAFLDTSRQYAAASDPSASSRPGLGLGFDNIRALVNRSVNASRNYDEWLSASTHSSWLGGYNPSLGSNDDPLGRITPSQRNWFLTQFADPNKPGGFSRGNLDIEGAKRMLAQLDGQMAQQQAEQHARHVDGTAGHRGDGEPADKAGAMIASHFHDAIKTPAFKESCANFVSQILHEAGIAVKGSDSAHVVKDELLRRGAVPVPVSQARAGDVLYWQDIQRRDGRLGNHIGFYEGGGKVRDSNNQVVRDSNMRSLDHLTVLRVPDSLIGKIDPNSVITDKPKKDKPGRDDSDARARDAETKAREGLQNAMREAQGHLKLLLHDFEGEGKPFSALAKAAKPWLSKLDQAHLALARQEGDREYLTLAAGGLSDSAQWMDTNRDKYAEQAKQKAQEAAKKQANFAAYYAEEAQKGPDGELAFGKVLDAQKAAIKAARLGGDDLELRKLLDGNSGPLADYKQRTRQERGEYDQSLTGRADNFLSTYYGSVMKNVDQGLRGLDLAQRPNNFFRSEAGQQSDEQNLLNGRVGVLTKGLSDLGPITDDNRDKFEQLTHQLEDAKKAVTDFADKVKATDFQRVLKREAAGTDEALGARTNQGGFRARQTEAQRYAAELEKLYEIRSILEADVNRIVGKPEYQGKADDVDAARRRFRGADRQYRDYPASYYNARYDETYQRVQGSVVGEGLNFFKGKSSVGQLAQGLGDQIVSTAQSEFLKHLTDPLVNSITKEILSLEGVRQAAENLTDVMQGKAPRNPTGSGAGAGGAGGKGKGGMLPGKGNQYLADGLAAYSVFSQGQQQGSSLGGVLGGAAAGFGIAGIPGAIAGGALNLIGGLFHKHSDPLQDSKTYDPSQYNSPSQMEFEAYRYRATGTLPTAKQMGIPSPGNAPVVNVFVDGVKTSVKSEIGNQMSTSSMAGTNAYLNFHEVQ